MSVQPLHYEDLRGSTGRRAFFRPRRYDAKDLFPAPPPRVRLGEESVWRLSDISLSGIAVTSRDIDETALEVGENLAVTIDQAGFPLFQGSATVRRVEPSGFGSKLALHFEDSFVDIPALRRKDAQARMRSHVATFRPIRNDAVPAEYRTLCSDVLSTLRSYRNFLDQRADLLDAARDGGGSGALELCVEQLTPQWRELWLRGNEVAEPLIGDKQRLSAVKQLTELVLTPEFRVGPIWDRGYSKPLGYPGDYQVMNYIYDWKREGKTTYSQLIHRLGLDVGEFIGTRMDMMVDIVLRMAERKPANEPLRVLSLGSGPAREIRRILQRTARGPTQFEFTLVDQEEQALEYAYEDNYPPATAHSAGATIRCLNLSFTDILRGNISDERTRDQDLVYSVGLFDYLKDRRAKALAKSLFELVRPGGMLVLGNMNKTPLSSFWPLECVADWRLYYRTETEMLDWTDDLDKDAAWTESDSTDRVRLLHVRKAAE